MITPDIPAWIHDEIAKAVAIADANNAPPGTLCVLLPPGGLPKAPPPVGAISCAIVLFVAKADVGWMRLRLTAETSPSRMRRLFVLAGADEAHAATAVLALSRLGGGLECVGVG